jgi:hypothetical protein
VAQFYGSLAQYTRSGEELSPRYLAMHASLMQGETTYNLADAKLLRVRLLKIAENIDLMSKRIESLGRESVAEGDPAPRRFRLQGAIRRAAVNFIKETLVGLPSLPTVEEAEVLQRQRQQEMQRQAEEERQRYGQAEGRGLNWQNSYFLLQGGRGEAEIPEDAGEKKVQQHWQCTACAVVQYSLGVCTSCTLSDRPSRSDSFRLPSPAAFPAPAFVRTGSFRNKVLSAVTYVRY